MAIGGHQTMGVLEVVSHGYLSTSYTYLATNINNQKGAPGTLFPASCTFITTSPKPNTDRLLPTILGHKILHLVKETLLLGLGVVHLVSENLDKVP